jgi:hypothetical protein
MTPDQAESADCAGCAGRIFRREDGTWDLVLKTQADSKVCFIRDGKPDQVAYEDGTAHVPFTGSGFDRGAPGHPALMAGACPRIGHRQAYPATVRPSSPFTSHMVRNLLPSASQCRRLVNG